MATREGPQTPHSRARLSGRYTDVGPRTWLGLLVAAWGVQAIVTQSLLLREAMVLMYGSELAWGIVLFAWLLGIAIGAAIGGRLAGSLARRGRVAGPLVGVLLALSLAAAFELWLFRGARAWLGVAPGELLPLTQTVWAALVFVAPVSALVGMAFPLACSVMRKSATTDVAGPAGSAPALSFGHVYAIESAGSLIGGAAFSFWAVERLSPIQIALVCGAATAAASAGFLMAQARQRRPDRRRLPVAAVGLMGLAGGAVLLALVAGEALDRRLVERRWKQLAPGYELVAETESKYQNLALGRRAGQFSLYCDGHVTADFPDPYTFAPLAHFWMCQHPAPRHVLLLGGAAEGLLSEVLRHPVEDVACVEPDPRQIELVLPYLAETDRAALSDPRVILHAVDARHFVKTQRARFDLVLARLPEPTSALRTRFYTDEFYAELRRAMTPEAVLCLMAAAAPTELSELSRDYLASMRETLRRHFPELVIGWGDPAQVLAATAPGLITTDPEEMSARYMQRGVNALAFDPAWFAGGTDWLEPQKLNQRAADLDTAGRLSICTDLRPSMYLQRLALWEASTGAPSGQRNPVHSRSWVRAWHDWGVVARLRSMGLTSVIAGLLVAGVVTLMAGRWRCGARGGWEAGAISASVASTGFATMALSVLWLFAFQNLYGYVYQRIGWIIALFMAGLVLGCIAAARSTNRSWRWLVRVDTTLALLAASVPLVWRCLAALQNEPGGFKVVEVFISAMVIATGLLGGAGFALAGRIQIAFSRGIGGAAGAVVGADHAGACVGALLCGIVLVPVFGVVTTALVLGGAKLASATLLWMMGRRKQTRNRMCNATLASVLDVSDRHLRQP